ncbi:hypothetical protein SUGI_1134920 [Cryptomeria japonica]|nr:hypothetical protein SUGI_1134920 [Cryptomeria japonica]
MKANNFCYTACPLKIESRQCTKKEVDSSSNGLCCHCRRLATVPIKEKAHRAMFSLTFYKACNCSVRFTNS